VLEAWLNCVFFNLLPKNILLKTQLQQGRAC